MGKHIYFERKSVLVYHVVTSMWSKSLCQYHVWLLTQKCYVHIGKILEEQRACRRGTQTQDHKHKHEYKSGLYIAFLALTGAIDNKNRNQM